MANRVVMKPQMKDTAFITDFVDERSILLMTHDTPSAHASTPGTPLGAQLEHWLLTMPSASGSAPHKRGRPLTLSAWHLRLDVLLDANADCKVHARAMLSGLANGTLLLFDLGYFSFPWLDELTHLGYWYVTRQRAKTRYQVVHILYQADGVFDALVYLGVHSSDRAGHMVRLVCFRLGSQQYCYLTNVLDPATLAIVDIARLYARRWDIELAFRELKEHLGLRLLWSAKLGVIYQQIWASLILAQLLHAYQVELAAQAGVEPFDVSLELLSRHVPRLLLHTADPMGFLLEHGRAMRLIRPASRLLREAPVVPLQEVSYPPPELLQPRPAHSAHRKCGSRYAAQS